MKKVLAVQQPEALAKLPHRICLAGLSHYVSHCLVHDWREERDLDIPTILVRIVEGIVDSSSRNHRFSSSTLNKEYTQISRAIIAFMSQSPNHVGGLQRAWMETIKQIKKFYHDREWLDTQSEIDALKVLIAVAESFLDLGMDVNLRNNPYFPNVAAPYSVQEESFVVSEVLLTWLARLSAQFSSSYEASTDFEARIERLQDIITVRRQVVDSPKQEDWSLWLERILPHCEFEEEPQNTRPPFAGSESLSPSLMRIIPGGLFELDSLWLKSIPKRELSCLSPCSQ